MRRDSRLSLALHALLHCAERDGRPITSDELAEMMGTHPVVMRRTMSGLRDAGIVRAERGHGGGFVLAKPLARVSLGDVFAALAIEHVFALGPRTESPGCFVEQAVNRELEGAFVEAEKVLVDRLHGIKLSSLAAQTKGRLRHA